MPDSLSDSVDLSSAEAQIEAGLAGYRQAIEALRDVRASHLYPNFLKQCERKWGLGRMRVLAALDSIEVLEDLIQQCRDAGVTPEPHYEEEVRPLVRMSRSDRLSVWQDAIKHSGGEVTPGAVADAVYRARMLQDPDPTPQQERLNPWLGVGLKLQNWRLDRGINQKQLGRLIDRELIPLGVATSQTTISRVERGKQQLTYLEALAICRVLEIPFDAFSPWKT